MTYRSNLEEHVRTLLEDHTLEEIFEMSNLDPLDAVMILFRAGHLDFPDVYDYEELDELSEI